MTIGIQNITNTIARLTPAQQQQLETAIANINALRGQKDTVSWRREWTAAHQDAANALSLNLRHGKPDDWNSLIDALDAYRADWRGYVVPVRGAA